MRGLQLVDSWSSRPGEPLAGLPKCPRVAGQKQALGAAQQPIQRRRGVPHHHFDPQSTRSARRETPAPWYRRTPSHLCRLKHCGCRPHRPLQPSPRCAVWEDNSRCCFAVGQWVLPGRQNSVRRGRKPMEKTKIDQTLRSGSFEFDLCQKSPGSSPKRSLRELVILTFENGRLTTREQRKAGLRPPCGTGTSPPLVMMPPVSRSEQSIAERGV